MPKKAKIVSADSLKIPMRVPEKHRKNIDKLEPNEALFITRETDQDCDDIDDIRRKVINFVKRTYGDQRSFNTRLVRNDKSDVKELYLIRNL